MKNKFLLCCQFLCDTFDNFSKSMHIAHLPQATTWAQGIKTVLHWSIKHILHSFDFSFGLSSLPSELFEAQLWSGECIHPWVSDVDFFPWFFSNRAWANFSIRNIVMIMITFDQQHMFTLKLWNCGFFFWKLDRTLCGLKGRLSWSKPHIQFGLARSKFVLAIWSLGAIFFQISCENQYFLLKQAFYYREST